MSIEAMKRAIEAWDACGRYPDATSDIDRLDVAINALRTAIQQAEAQQPATGEPVQTTPNFTQLMQILDGLNRCHSRDSKVEFLRTWIRDWTQHKVDKLTHPVPSVPADVVRDAERYRWLRDNGVLEFSGPPSWRVSVSFDEMDAYAQTLDSNIDTAMLSAKDASA